jgi:hypothetical protein
MNMKERIHAKGQVWITLRGQDGKIKERTVENLVVTVGRRHIADQLSGQLEAAMSHMATGSGTTAQVIGDTALETEINRKVFTSKTQGAGADANKVIYITEWAPGEGTGAITEAGIFNASTAGIMLSRTTFAVKNKGAGDSLTLTWTITISG